MVGVGMVVALFFTVRQRDWIYGMVIVWAFAGIAAKHGDVTLVAGPALGAAAIIALSILAIAWQSRLGTHKWAEVRAAKSSSTYKSNTSLKLTDMVHLCERRWTFTLSHALSSGEMVIFSADYCGLGGIFCI